MKAAGIVRSVDDLLRIVIPKEIKRTSQIREKDSSLTIFTSEEQFVRAITNVYIWRRNKGLCEKKAEQTKADSHRDLYALKRIFSRNTASKNHGRRQPCRDSLFCLTGKSLTLECLAVLKLRFFLTGISR